MGTLARQRHTPRARRSHTEESADNMRAVGIFFLLLATASLAWDANIILTGYGVKGVSGILHIWQALDRTSLQVIEQIALAKMGYEFWFYFAVPFMSLPAFALFGVIGLMMVQGHDHEIKARAPSAMEVEMMRQGLDPRRARRR